jgi:hypothetical protein
MRAEHRRLHSEEVAMEEEFLAEEAGTKGGTLRRGGRRLGLRRSSITPTQSSTMRIHAGWTTPSSPPRRAPTRSSGIIYSSSCNSTSSVSVCTAPVVLEIKFQFQKLF